MKQGKRSLVTVVGAKRRIREKEKESERKWSDEEEDSSQTLASPTDSSQDTHMFMDKRVPRATTYQLKILKQATGHSVWGSGLSN